MFTDKTKFHHKVSNHKNCPLFLVIKVIYIWLIYLIFSQLISFKNFVR